ncbi:MAG TPA: ABC transporter substrate-binding protein [Stellaceae bacterium]|nr:ABC transporter substrate-binding protein [Stellaceae bacterium]
MRLGFSRLLAGAIAAAAFCLPVAGNAQQPINVVIALPAQTLTFSAPFLAEDAGFFKDEGLKVSYPVLVGVASVNAVINGSADFTIGTGPVFLRAAAKGQRLLAIANLMDRPMIELVMRKDVYEAMKANDQMTLAERGKLLKDKTIAIQGVGSIVHAWPRLVAARGGLDPENDMRIAPMEPPSMLPALLTKAVDGFATSLPYTTDAVLSGAAMMYASAPQGAAPDILPFAAALVETKPDTCKADPDKCARVVRALARAVKMIRDKPDEALAIVRTHFKEMKPETLQTAWRVVSQAHAADLRVLPKGLENSEKVNVEAKLLDPNDVVRSYDGLYTDDFVR